MADLETVQYVEDVQLLHEYVLGVHAQLQQLVVATLRRSISNGIVLGVSDSAGGAFMARRYAPNARPISPFNNACAVVSCCIFCFPEMETQLDTYQCFFELVRFVQDGSSPQQRLLVAGSKFDANIVLQRRKWMEAKIAWKWACECEL